MRRGRGTGRARRRGPARRAQGEGPRRHRRRAGTLDLTSARRRRRTPRLTSRPDARRIGRRDAKVRLYLHASLADVVAGDAGDATGTVESLGPATLDLIREWAGRVTRHGPARPARRRRRPLVGRPARPAARMAEQVRLRDETCVFPWCGRPPASATSTTASPSRTPATADHRARHHPTRSPRSVGATTGRRPPGGGPTNAPARAPTSGPDQPDSPYSSLRAGPSASRAPRPRRPRSPSRGRPRSREEQTCPAVPRIVRRCPANRDRASSAARCRSRESVTASRAADANPARLPSASAHTSSTTRAGGVTSPKQSCQASSRSSRMSSAASASTPNSIEARPRAASRRSRRLMPIDGRRHPAPTAGTRRPVPDHHRVDRRGRTVLIVCMRASRRAARTSSSFTRQAEHRSVTTCSTSRRAPRPPAGPRCALLLSTFAWFPPRPRSGCGVCDRVCRRGRRHISSPTDVRAGCSLVSARGCDRPPSRRGRRRRPSPGSPRSPSRWPARHRPRRSSWPPHRAQLDPASFRRHLADPPASSCWPRTTGRGPGRLHDAARGRARGRGRRARDPVRPTVALERCYVHPDHHGTGSRAG